jgi:hypothetical protein
MYDPGQLYVDPILTGFSVGFQDQELISRAIMPEVPVRTQSGKYLVFDRSAWMIYESRRAPGTVAHEIAGAKWSSDTFATHEHSLQAPVHDEERQELNSLGGLANPVFGGPLQIDPEVDATNLVTSSLLLDHERQVANLVRNPANYPATNKVALAGAQQFDNYTFVTAGDTYSIVSDPVGTLRAASNAIWQQTRRRPNTLVIPALGIDFIENHPRVVRRFEHFTFTMDDAFRTLFNFDGQVLLAQSGYNAANNMDAAEQFTDLWGKDIWLGIVDPTPQLRTKTFGKTFAQIYPDGTIRPTDRWREENRKTDIVRTSYKWDLKVVSSVAGYLIQNAFSAGAWT